MIRKALCEEAEDVPLEFRPPRGQYVRLSATRSARVIDTAARQAVIGRAFNAVRDDDASDVVLCAWLDVRPDDGGVERVAVLLGSHLVGFLDQGDSDAMRRRVRRRVWRRSAAWVDAYITREASGYVVDVNLA
jgi:hypothetical protein